MKRLFRGRCCEATRGKASSDSRRPKRGEARERPRSCERTDQPFGGRREIPEDGNYKFEFGGH
jgi:hypothetical protein